MLLTTEAPDHNDCKDHAVGQQVCAATVLTVPSTLCQLPRTPKQATNWLVDVSVVYPLSASRVHRKCLAPAVDVVATSTEPVLCYL